MAKNSRKKTYCENNKKPLPQKPNSRLEQYLDYMIRNGQYAELTKDNDGATHYVVVNGQWVPAGDDYMCYVCEEDAKIMVSVVGEVPFPNLSYSFDKVTWHRFIDETSYVNIEAGQEIYFKGVNERTGALYVEEDEGDVYEWYERGWQIIPFDENEEAVSFSVYGNPASILFGADVSGVKLSDGAFAYFFLELPIVHVEKVPACKLSKYCYSNMFSNCTSLTEAPELPATELAEWCYSGMFYGCASLTEAPELPATELAEGCYSGMFSGCTSLTEAPELPATELAEWCYSGMFSGCTSLTEAPELPATELANWCYETMFSNRTSLTEAPELPATELAEGCYSGMFSGCMSLTQTPELPATELAEECYGHMFSGCTSLTEAPELPATELAEGCYETMFSYCTSLTEAPELPATELDERCYSGMFSGCTSLDELKVRFTNGLGKNSTAYWLDGVSATGTFYCPEELAISERGPNTVPSGWTIERITA